MKWGVRKEPYTKDQIRQRRKQLVESAPYKTSRYQKAPSKGYWKNASDAQISRLMDTEGKQARKANKKPMSTAKKVAIGVAVTAAVAGITYAAVKTGKTKQVSVGAKLVHTKTPKELAKNVYNGRKIVKPNKNLGRFSSGRSTGKYTIRTLDRTPPRYKKQRIYNLSRNTYGHNKISYSNHIRRH